jgi:UDP-N-acetyl-D-glucosamine dehydrogenase
MGAPGALAPPRLRAARGERVSEVTDAPTERAAAEAVLRERIEARTARCAVVGLGFIGATMLRAIASTGFVTSGVDRASSVADHFAGARVSRELSDVAEADVVVIAVRVAPARGGGVDLEPLEAVGAGLSDLPERARLVVLVSTVPPGTTRAFATRFLPGTHAFTVHAPERLQVDDSAWTLDRIPHVVGGVDEPATRLGALFVATLTESVLPVQKPEVSELAKLLENSANAVGIALIGEVTRLAHVLGIDMAEVSAAAATKPFGYRAFHPGPGIGGHCIPNDLRMLRNAAHEAQVPTRVLDATIDVSAEMPVDTVDRLERLLAARGMSLAGADVLLVGLGFKIGTADTAATPARHIARELRRRGAIPLAVDSRVDGLTVDDTSLERVNHRTLGHGRMYSAGIVLAGDPGVAAHALAQSVSVLLDAGGGRALDGALDGPARL